MQEIVVRIAPRAKFVFHILLYLEWYVKNCFEKQILITKTIDLMKFYAQYNNIVRK